MIRSKRFRLVPAPVRSLLYKRRGWYWYWTLVGNVRRGPAAELRALHIYITSMRPLRAPARQVLLALIALHLRTAAEGRPVSGARAIMVDPDFARLCIHDTTAYERPETTITFIPGVRRGIRDSASGQRREGEVG